MSDAPTISKLALKGSSKIVSDYFEYCLHTILYQRGIYPADEFRQVQKYGLPMVLSLDPDVEDYLERLMKPIHKWVYSGKITRLVLVIIRKSDEEIVEKWEFNLVVDKHQDEIERGTINESEHLRHIQKTIQGVFKQITASITFLPMLEGEHTFNVLVYANPNCKVTEDWGYFDQLDKLAMDTKGVEAVMFKSIETSNHLIGTTVTYKVEDELDL